MCGIFGCLQPPNQRPDLDQLRTLTDMMSHRGPDGCDYAVVQDNSDGAVSFGHRRLSIIDLTSNGAQPMWSACGTYCLVYNGEIYNYVELREELVARGVVFRSSSDSEVLLGGYMEWGVDVLPRLRGMFAFAIFDKSDGSVVLARDHFGKKPLYLARTGDGLFFSSEIVPLTRIRGFRKELNLSAIPQCLANRYVPGPATLFQGIEKLPPGSYGLWRRGRLDVTSYFSPPVSHVEPDVSSFDEAVDLFGAALTDAVRIRMRSDAPFGAFLSGGIDSSTIVGLMQACSGQPVRTFSVGFDEAGFSELSFCREVADRFRTDHAEHVVSAADFRDAWDEAIAHRGAPVSEASDIPLMLLAKQARSSVKVVLTGEGADEILAGYPKYQAERYAGLYQSVLPGLLHDNLVAPVVNRLPLGYWRLKAVAGVLAERNSDRRIAKWFASFSVEEVGLLLGADTPPLSVHPASRPALGTMSDVRRLQLLDQLFWLPDNLLERTDRMLMAHSIEGRMPFMDVDLAILAARCPDKFLLRNGGKAVLRAAFRKLVPGSVLRRSKNGFKVPIAEWFRHQLRDTMRDLLQSDASRVRKLLVPSEIDRYVGGHLDGKANFEKALWSLCNLEKFLRIFDPAH